MSAVDVDKERIALGIRQPWVELILRGVKTIEVRSKPTNVRGPIYVYAAKKFSDYPDAASAAQQHGLDASDLLFGLIVGQVTITNCRPAVANDVGPSCVSEAALANQYAWELQDAVQFDEPIKPRFLPYGVWFYPFKRRPQST